ncbi:ATPase [Alcanivorax sp. KX64203]|nr:ATPase [Alcanivorax sp. KX64203]
MYRSRTLEELFRDTFYRRYHTVLEGGAEEPVYLPGEDGTGTPHRIVYTRDYFRSALHEVAHWCVAGRHRRTLEDYGYWYAPDGRDAAQQSLFARVEESPQALEALFCAACGYDFRVSMDNLDGDEAARRLETAFAEQVYRRARRYLEEGLPARPLAWCQALADCFNTGWNGGAESLDRIFIFPTDVTD